jgi:hypothetical protein
MKNERDIEEIVVILGNLDGRLFAAETAITELRQSVEQLTQVTTIQQKSIMNLQDRMTHEGLSILEIIGDIKAQLDPVYWRVMPGYAKFTDELSRFFKRGKPPA